jgi:hypothetical protein
MTAIVVLLYELWIGMRIVFVLVYGVGIHYKKL